MSRNYIATMTTPNMYPYGGNYGSLYWPGQTENQVNGYFDPYRLPSNTIPATQGYGGHCKSYTEADSTQQSAAESQIHHEKPVQLSADPRSLSIPSSTEQQSTGGMILLGRNSSNKRKPTPVCDDRKDHHYFERRNRNNESAKKSRMNRKQREEQNGFRCLCLERENLQLRADIRYLEEENKKLRCLQFRG